MITTREQYEATCDLLDFLDALSVTVSANTWNILTEDYGEFEPCTKCGEILEECYCGDDAPNYYAEYDDEASFD